MAKYCIEGKFGRDNVWQIYSSQVFGGKKVWRMNRSAKGLLIVTTTLDVLSRYIVSRKFTIIILLKVLLCAL